MAGDPELMSMLAFYWWKHSDRAEAQSTALYWWRRAALLGHQDSQELLGLIHTEGFDGAVEIDYGEAAKWYTMLAEAGNREAQSWLGYHLFLGEGPGLDIDLDKSIHWLNQAAAHGDLKCQLMLSMCYAHGRGVPQDHAKAVELCTAAAAAGSQQARAFLEELSEAERNGAGAGLAVAGQHSPFAWGTNSVDLTAVATAAAAVAVAAVFYAGRT